MELRAAAAEATRERILAAAADLFLERWYDDVTSPRSPSGRACLARR